MTIDFPWLTHAKCFPLLSVTHGCFTWTVNCHMSMYSTVVASYWLLLVCLTKCSITQALTHLSPASLPAVLYKTTCFSTRMPTITSWWVLWQLEQYHLERQTGCLPWLEVIFCQLVCSITGLRIPLSNTYTNILRQCVLQLLQYQCSNHHNNCCINFQALPGKLLESSYQLTWRFPWLMFVCWKCCQ